MQNHLYLPPGRISRQEVALAHPDVIDVGEADSRPRSAGWMYESWEVLLRHKLLLLGTTLAFGLLSFLATLQMTPLFRARTAIEVQQGNENFLNLNGAVPAGITASSSNYLHLLGSVSLADRVVGKLKLDQYFESDEEEPSAMGQLIADARQWLGRPAILPASAKERARNAVLNGLEIVPLRDSTLVEIYYNSPDPELCAQVANTLTQEFIAQNQELSWDTAESASEWLNTYTKELKNRLRESEAKLQAYSQESGLVFTADKESVAAEKLRQLQTEVSRAQTERMSQQSRYEIAAAVPRESLPEVLNDEVLRNYQVQLTALRGELANLSTLLTPNHYKVEQIAAQIAQLEKTVELEHKRMLDRLRHDYDSSKRNEDLLLSAYNNQTKLVSEQAVKNINYQLLSGEVESNRLIYETVLQKGKEAGVVSAMRPNNIRVVDPAEPPLSPHSPALVMNSALGLITGLFFGTLLVFVRENATLSRKSTDRTLYGPGDASTYLGVPELGVIPSGTDELKQLEAAALNGHAPKKRLLRLFESNGSNGAVDAGVVELMAWKQSPSRLAESFRATVTSILFADQRGKGPETIVITSPIPGEGKTTTTTNLGISLARINQRVLLLDGDMRRSQLHRIFRLDNSKGLSSLLREEWAVEQNLVGQYIHKTEIPGLDVLPGGPRVDNAPDLLYSPRMLALLWRLRKDYDTILIDAPPVLPVADARVLGKLADAVILVFRAGKTSADLAMTAKQLFDKDGTPILGTILNDWDSADAGDGYGSYYSYSNTEDCA